jgi:hypothetical protein
VIGLLFVPGSAVIALLKNDINTELRVPFTTLITNNWLGNAGTASFVENVCLRGSFKSDYSKLCKSDGTEPLQVKRANVSQKDSGCTAQQTTTFMIPLADSYQIDAESAKIFN